MKKPILEQKDFLNPEETIRLFNLSRRKFYRFLKDEKGVGFTALYGNRKLIIRTEFEKYLRENQMVKGELQNASKKSKDSA